MNQRSLEPEGSQSRPHLSWKVLFDLETGSRAKAWMVWSGRVGEVHGSTSEYANVQNKRLKHALFGTYGGKNGGVLDSI